MDPVYIEYGNQHDHRNYPFQDNSSLTSEGGVVLPEGYIRDLFLYPIDGVGPFYLQTLAVADGYILFADAGTGEVVGRADWSLGDLDAAIYEVSGYQRQIGLVVFGEQIGQITGESVMVFSAAATTIVGTCAIPLSQEGVRGLLCGDSLVTGIITISGKNGVNVHTTVDIPTGRNILRIDAVGEPPAPDQDCDGGPPIETIHIINEICAAMVASGDSEGNIYLTGRPGWTVADNCPPAALPDAQGNLPTKKTDPCNPSPPPSSGSPA